MTALALSISASAASPSLKAPSGSATFRFAKWRSPGAETAPVRSHRRAADRSPLGVGPARARRALLRAPYEGAARRRGPRSRQCVLSGRGGPAYRLDRLDVFSNSGNCNNCLAAYRLLSCAADRPILADRQPRPLLDPPHHHLAGRADRRARALRISVPSKLRAHHRRDVCASLLRLAELRSPPS